MNIGNDPRSLFNGNHFSSWASEASPSLGCLIEISRDWESEASPILGCSIEISRDIYLCVCRGPKCARRITWPNTRMLKVSLGRLKPTSVTLIIHFHYTLEQL